MATRRREERSRGRIVGDHEAEAAAWVPLRDVSRQLAYPNERRIVRIALDLLYRDSRG